MYKMGLSKGLKGTLSNVDRQCQAGEEKLKEWKEEVEARAGKDRNVEVGRRRVRRTLTMDSEWMDVEDEAEEGSLKISLLI